MASKILIAFAVCMLTIQGAHAQQGQQYFEKGALRLTATDNDGWASLVTYVSRWNDEKRGWESAIREAYTQDGKRDYSLSPGVYRLQMYYREASPSEERVIEGIQIADRQALSIGETFGGGNLPPLISAGGPFEIGDGDSYYEVDEKVLFRIDIQDSDFGSVEFLINDRIIRTSDRAGKFEQILQLTVPGSYRFSVRAKDKSGTLESYGRTIPVSMQKERSGQAAKYLPVDYGQKKTVKKCPKCGKEYQNNIAFCPYDGSKLNPVERVVHGVLDASLIRAHIDPETPEAQQAKQFGVDWLNPFASQERIDEDIQRLVDDVMKK